VARRTRGEFFGELAALDWGAGYGRVRAATVRAREPLRLLVLASEHLNALMASAPSVAESVQRAVCARLAAA
jgi:CRP-like cAMP-binding protein